MKSRRTTTVLLSLILQAILALLAPLRANPAKPSPTPSSDVEVRVSLHKLGEETTSTPGAQRSSSSKPAYLVYETGLNDTTGLEFKSGATLGSAGSGVSGKPVDRAYSADTSTASNAAALITAINPPVKADELTVTAWVKPRTADQKDVATLFSGFGSGLYYDAKSKGWLWRVASRVPTDPKAQTWYDSGKSLQLQPGQWHYVAMVWKRADNSASFFHGGTNGSVLLVNTVKRPQTVDSATEPSAKRILGNDPNKPERCFNGEIDNFRVYTKALDPDALEKIRQTDLKNESPAL
jgi:hypothetical protein